MIPKYYDKLLAILNKKYSVVDTIDLSEPDITSTLLTRLTPFKDKVFADSERLLIVADKTLPTTFDGQPPDILPKFQEYVRDLNIPHFFIIIVTDIENLNQHLPILKASRYYQETNPITVITARH